MSRFKKGSAAAKRYMARLRGMRKRKTSARTSAPSRVHRVKKMVRRYRRYPKRSRRSGGMTIPLAPIVGFAPMVLPALDKALKGDMNEAGVQLMWNTIGVARDGGFSPQKLLANITPLIVGLLIHKFVGGRPLNLNGILAKAKVPFIRI